MSTEFDWLDEVPTEKAKNGTAGKAKKRRVKKSARKAEKATRVTPGKKLDHEPLRGRSMFVSVKGRKRIWACDGEYVFFRRKSCIGIDPKTGTEVRNDASINRHEGFLRNGDYTYVETQDDVEICKVNPQSAFFRKGAYLGEMSDGAVRRQVEIAATKRDWVLYTDALEELAGRIKNRGYTPAYAKQVFDEYVVYIRIMIAARGGPTPPECDAGLQNVRKQRGVGSGRVILLPGGSA